MLSKKKTFIISIICVIVTGIISSAIVYSFISQTSKIKNTTLYGTYQLNKSIDNAEYLAVIPPLSTRDNESNNQFQWYNGDKKIIAQGVYEINKEGYILLNVNGKTIGIISVNNEKYYFINDILEIQEVTKISEEPIVFNPLDK